LSAGKECGRYGAWLRKFQQKISKDCGEGGKRVKRVCSLCCFSDRRQIICLVFRFWSIKTRLIDLIGSLRASVDHIQLFWLMTKKDKAMFTLNHIHIREYPLYSRVEKVYSFCN
jgi:hypothetical protein